MAIRAAIEPIAVPAGLVPVISNERLVGHALSAGIDRAAIARRLHAVFPEARVLLVIREQRAMLLSSYIQYLGYGGWYGIDRFLAAPSDLRAPTIDLRHWQYDRAIALYQEVFGADRVLVLPFEMFVRDNAAYVAAICRFMNATTPADLPAGRVENVSRPYVSSYCLRWLTCINRSSSANAFFPQFLSAGAGKLLDRGVKHAVDLLMPQAFERRLKRTLTEKIARRVEGLYAESNRRAALLSRLDLASYGYDCSAAATISS
ncbi:MAG: sulfotransferase [Rhizobiales bacterium]|nr:sulfotransferase [Hyphomicrobiales bacterium]